MKSAIKLLAAPILLILICYSSFAEEPENYEVSPQEPWNDISNLPQETETNWANSLLMYLPNRFLDLLDIFKADVGVGPASGAVLRLTKYGQVGYRSMSPASARLGLLGRIPPIMMETSKENGIGPYYSKSKDRKVCWGEVGAGLDLFIVGAYAGVCPDEFFDFLGGFFFMDFKDDDLK